MHQWKHNQLQSLQLRQHVADTLAAGDGLSDPVVTRKILQYGPSAIQELITNGVQFDQTKGNYSLAREGGHSARRIFHVGDMTGKAVIEALVKQVNQLEQVTVFAYHAAINLVAKCDEQNETNILGAYVLNEKTEKIHVFLANVTVLATGGAGKVYRYTSGIDVATGDGIAMAYRAGARVADMEFYQFHPTLLYHHEVNNFLITEAMRGEGAYLLNADTLERFMGKYAPEKMELATRDIVARAVANEIEHSEKHFVYLDIRHKSREFLLQHFPTIFEQLLKLGIDISKDLIPVVPGAHYLCGGVITDINGVTTLKGLYAVGETACTGLHGANRLASNSLLEGLVMAHYAAQHSAKIAHQISSLRDKVDLWHSREGVVDALRASQIRAHWRSLRGEMTSYAGIIRTGAGLKDLLQLTNKRAAIVEAYYQRHAVTRDLIELRNIILVAELIAHSALKREESRGGHYREDFPQTNERAVHNIFYSNLLCSHDRTKQKYRHLTKKNII